MKIVRRHFFVAIPDHIRDLVMLKLRVGNGQRIFLISVIGVIFFLLFMGLDYFRFLNGKIKTGALEYYLFLTHLCFALFIFPIITILTNRKTFARGEFKHGRFFIYTWTIFLGLLLLSMAILSFIHRGDLTFYFVYIFVVNFGLIMQHRDRILLNLVSLVVIIAAIISIDLYQPELFLIHIFEAVGVMATSFVVSTQIFNAYLREIVMENLLQNKSREIKKEKKRGDDLLHNILPEEVARELKTEGTVKPRQYSNASIMLIDFKDFSIISKSMTHIQLINELDYCFKNFDRITASHNLEKIKTMGDSYLCVGGVPESNTTHPFDCIAAAKEIFEFLDSWKLKKIEQHVPYFEARIGIHSGPVIAGVVGDKKFVFDIWGDAVNITARIESAGQAGRINISQSTYELVNAKLPCTYRGIIPIKNYDPLKMYFVRSDNDQ